MTQYQYRNPEKFNAFRLTTEVYDKPDAWPAWLRNRATITGQDNYPGAPAGTFALMYEEGFGGRLPRLVEVGKWAVLDSWGRLQIYEDYEFQKTFAPCQ